MKNIFLLFLMLWFFGLHPQAKAADAAPSVSEFPKTLEENRRGIWSFGLSGSRHSLKSGNGDEGLSGNSGTIHLCTGTIAKSWYSLVSVDILLGPFEPALSDQLNIDHQGTGLTLWTGFSAQTLDLRSEAGGYGFALGLSYADQVGRSIGANRKDDGSASPENRERLDSYSIRITNFSLLPALFFSWLKPSRPDGNTPDLLATRTEGYLLTLGVAVPLLVSYSSRSTQLDGSKNNQTGQLRGYSVIISLHSLLGT